MPKKDVDSPIAAAAAEIQALVASGVLDDGPLINYREPPLGFSAGAALVTNEEAARNVEAATLLLKCFGLTPNNALQDFEHFSFDFCYGPSLSDFVTLLRKHGIGFVGETGSTPQSFPSYSPQSGVKSVQQKRIITVKGERFYPATLAAECAQVGETRMRLWIQKAVSFNGKKIKSYQSPVTQELYIEESAVERLANRFIKVPSGEPAPNVVIGVTDDQSGYIHVSDAARLVGIKQPAFWKWASRGEVPSLHKSLAVVKCPISDHMYVAEREAYELAEVRRTVGLKHSSTRPQSTQPSPRQPSPSAPGRR